MTGGPSFCFSIVSHGHDETLRTLLADFRQLAGAEIRLVVVLNIPARADLEAEFADLPITWVRNPEQRGFAANNNTAFALCREDVFVTVNPDVSFDGLDLVRAATCLADPGVGCCAPVCLNEDGSASDNARTFPTLWSLARRVVGGRQGKPELVAVPDADALSADWLSGAFIFFDAAAFRAVGGFDEGYRLYMEDVDMGKKQEKAGYRRLLLPDLKVVHVGRRESRINMRHLRWHVGSLARYFAKSALNAW